MSGVDFWRLPPPDLPSSDESGDEIEAVTSNAAKQEAVSLPEAVAGSQAESSACSVDTAATATASTGQPTIAWQEGASNAVDKEPLCWRTSGREGCTAAVLEDVLGLDEEMLRGCNFPVSMVSLASYLRSLSLDDPRAEAAFLRGELPVASSALAQTWLGAQLLQDCGEDAIPPELQLAAGTSTGVPNHSRRGSLHAGRSEVLSWGSGSSTASTTCISDGAKKAEVQEPRSGWGVLYNGAVGQLDPTVCGPIRAVPQLPNPLTMVTDVPALIDEMLAEVPRGDWDSKRFWAPVPVPGFPGLCRGPGGLLPAYTPRQLAQNELAAAILNRLCANLLTAAASCTGASKASQGGPRLSPEESAVAAARERLAEASEAVRQADAEASQARANLLAGQAASRPDIDELRNLESIVGWKTSVATQAAGELQECQKSLSAAEEVLGERKSQKQAASWSDKWSNLVPTEAAAESFFGVRLTTKGQVAFTVKDFVQAMQTGQHDRQAGGYVQKHALEAAFVRHVADSLLLCTRKGDKPEAAEVYTHMPTAATTGCGIVDPSCPGRELRTPRPNHAFILRMEGQTFAFSVFLGALAGDVLGFVGLGTRALTYSTPWNQLEYGDVLWAQEAQESLSILPVVTTLANLVADPALGLGPFPPVQRSPEVPLVIAGLALLQTALFNDLKLWPVALPEAARLRWDYALRTLRHMLGHSAEDDLSEMDVGLVRNEVVPRCLEVLPKVSSDDGHSHAMGKGSCGSFIDRLKRMEMSTLSQAPFKSASTFRKLLDELLEVWPQFADDTATA